jgi:spore maturation protein SpmA
VLNAIWLALVLCAVLFAAATGTMKAVSDAMLASAKSAIELVIGLAGAMMVFLGLVRVASEGGLLRFVVRALRPLLRRLFPDVPGDHPAMTAILMNFSTNVLGLGNAATPFGLKAMVELDKLNPHRGVATNAMALFLAINTSSIVLMAPTGTIAVRAAAGSQAPFAIWIPTLIATTCSTLAAVAVCLLLQRLPAFAAKPLPAGTEPEITPHEAPAAELPDLEREIPPAEPWRKLVLAGYVVALLALLAWSTAPAFREGRAVAFLRDEVASQWLLPLLAVTLLLIGFAGRARAYDAMIDGAREALGVVIRIAPYMVAILVAVGMFRASGAVDVLVGALDPLTSPFGVPAEALPMAILRPLSGSGAFAVMSEIVNTHGPDSKIGFLVCTVMGSTETVFYVLAVYLGAIGVRDTRHIVPACVAGDLAGFAGAVIATNLFWRAPVA